MRFLSIDLGDVRTGLAVGDDESGLVSPCGLIEISRVRRRVDLLDAIVEAVNDHAPDVVVLGLPVNMDGTEGDRASIVRAFADALADRIDAQLAYQDERLTSFAAEQHLNRSGRTHGQKRKLRDQLAAVEILKDYLSRREHS